MLSFRAIARLTFLAALMLGAGCSSTTSQHCAFCDAGESDRPSDPVASSPDTAPIADTEAAVADQALAFDQEGSETAPIDQDAPGIEAARPSPVPDGGVLL
jgi:hypothetical protein